MEEQFTTNREGDREFEAKLKRDSKDPWKQNATNQIKEVLRRLKTKKALRWDKMTN